MSVRRFDLAALEREQLDVQAGHLDEPEQARLPAARQSGSETGQAPPGPLAWARREHGWQVSASEMLVPAQLAREQQSGEPRAQPDVLEPQELWALPQPGAMEALKKA